jgi:hypothetical protein
LYDAESKPNLHGRTFSVHVLDETIFSELAAAGKGSAGKQGGSCGGSDVGLKEKEGAMTRVGDSMTEKKCVATKQHQEKRVEKMQLQGIKLRSLTIHGIR